MHGMDSDSSAQNPALQQPAHCTSVPAFFLVSAFPQSLPLALAATCMLTPLSPYVKEKMYSCKRTRQRVPAGGTTRY